MGYTKYGLVEQIHTPCDHQDAPCDFSFLLTVLVFALIVRVVRENNDFILIFRSDFMAKGRIGYAASRQKTQG